MDSHRRVSPNRCRFYDLAQPFSSFGLVDYEFNGLSAARRCFSLARSFKCKTLVIEDISASGIIEDENAELDELYPGYQCESLKRLSFWRPSFKTTRGIASRTNDELAGYAILKKDRFTESRSDWHIFEAVFRKYEHEHNCVPSPGIYRVNFLDKIFDIDGVLYCQQNSGNKSCAHVALRSLLSRLVPEEDISYRQLNKIAQAYSSSLYSPAQGLSIESIQGILNEFDVQYTDLDYEEVSKEDPDIRTAIPYQKYLYAGVESGCGGLLGFSMSGPKANKEVAHIIPFYGHTFNKDTWAPEADISYFNMGSGVGYIPSEMWTSSFIGHDDNFGPNFCIPRLYVKPENAQYVVELKKPMAKYGGIIAEAKALQFLYSLHPNLESKNRWTERLRFHSDPGIQRVVLRAICVERDDYLGHLRTISCWDGENENTDLTNALPSLLPELLWVVEVSLPHLFPANERKLGEIVLNTTIIRDQGKSVDYKLFLMARFPDRYYFQKSINQEGTSFVTIPSKFRSHTPVILATLES